MSLSALYQTTSLNPVAEDDELSDDDIADVTCGVPAVNSDVEYDTDVELPDRKVRDWSKFTGYLGRVLGKI